MKRFIKWSLCTCMLLLPFFLIAQRSISGTVTDIETNEPLIGANLLVKGTSIGTSTNIDGAFTLNIPADATTLLVTYTGYTDLETEITGDVLNIVLSSGSLLDEVVVIGYGTVKRDDATGAIASVDSEEFNKGAITSAQQLLAGKVAGVSIINGGAPGDGAQIRIRGGSSVLASNDPLIVIDGVPIENANIGGGRNILNVVHPNDIESMTVLKDASATAIYGSRASGGVILITTKKGTYGQKFSVNYTGNVSISQQVNRVDVLNGDEYRALVAERFEEGHPAHDIVGENDTDWQEVIYQDAINTDHNVSLSGGIDALPYRLSLAYTDQRGILKTDRFNRKTAALNLSPKYLDNRLQFNINIKGMQSDNDFANRAAIGSAVSFDPTQPVYDEDSPFGGYFTWTQNNGNPITIATSNPLAQIELREDISTVQRFIANASVDYRFGFLPGLRANLNVGTDRSNAEGSVVVPENASWKFSADPDVAGGEMTTYSGERTNELLEYYMQYDHKFGNSKFDLMGGYSWQHFFDDNRSLRTNFDGSVVEDENLGRPRELYLVSLFGRANYSLLDRYLLTFTLRRDGTSRFSPEARWGLFPSAAAAVKIVDGGDGMLSDLKLRLGYGVTGQQDIDPENRNGRNSYYSYLAIYTASQATAQYQLGDQFYTTFRPGPFDLFIRWEETTTYNAGLDFGFKDDRLSGSLEVYRRSTKDLLNNIPIAAGTNFSNRLDTNVGDLINNGVELSVFVKPVKTDDLDWTIGANAAYNDNEIINLLALNDPEYLGVATGGISGGVGNNIQIHSVGFPVSSFFVYEQVYDDSGLPIEGEYVDRNEDGIISPLDQYHLEKPAADMNFGLTSNLYYKNFDFSFAGRASIGNFVYNNIQSDFTNFGRMYNSTNYLSNIHADYTQTNFENAELFSDLYVQNASFFRLDHITLGYTFTEVLKKPTLKVFATVQNPLVITKYTGLDPEIDNGIDNNIYPRARTILFGVNAQF